MSENKTINNVMDSFIGDYMGRDKSITFSDWLGERLSQDMPNISEGDGQKLSNDIIAAVSDYDKTLGELNEAVSAGQSKEEWFSERLLKESADMDINAFGNKLQQIEQGLNTSSSELLGEDIADEVKEAESSEWNKYSIKAKISEIGQQVILNGMSATALAIQQNIEGDGSVGIGGAIKEALLSGEDVDKEEVKAVVSGAIKTAAALGLDDALPADVSVKLTGDIGGMAVEMASAFVDLVTGKITMAESQDIIGRVGIAGSCRMLATILKEVISPISFIPIVGKQLSCAVSGLIDKVSEKAANFIFDVTLSLREGLNKVGDKVKSGLKNFANKIFS